MQYIIFKYYPPKFITSKDITIETYFYARAYLDCLDDQYTVCQPNAIWSWQRLQQVVSHPEPTEKIWYNITICDSFSSFKVLKHWNDINIWAMNKILTWMPVVAHFVRYRLKLQFDHVQKSNRGLDGSVPLVWLGFPNLKCPK